MSSLAVRVFDCASLEAARSAPAGDEHHDEVADTAVARGERQRLQRRAQLVASRQARREALASAQDVHTTLHAVAALARLYPPQGPDLSGHTTPMVLNSAYLVADERAGEFARTVGELAARHRGVRLTLTGPWPGYSFAGEQAWAGSR